MLSRENRFSLPFGIFPTILSVNTCFTNLPFASSFMIFASDLHPAAADYWIRSLCSRNKVSTMSVIVASHTAAVTWHTPTHTHTHTHTHTRPHGCMHTHMHRHTHTHTHTHTHMHTHTQAHTHTWHHTCTNSHRPSCPDSNSGQQPTSGTEDHRWDSQPSETEASQHYSLLRCGSAQSKRVTCVWCVCVVCMCGVCTCVCLCVCVDIWMPLTVKCVTMWQYQDQRGLYPERLVPLFKCFCWYYRVL